MNSIIVTGGAGFIGCNFVRFALAQTPLQIVVIDKLTYAGNLLSLQGVFKYPRIKFIKADIKNGPRMASVLKKYQPTSILNFAAETHVDRSIDNPSVFIQTNIMGTFQLLEAARHYHRFLAWKKRSRFRFLHVSTDEVFGSLGPRGRFSENTPYDPRSPYSASKAAADHLTRAYFETYKLPILITNCSNNFGPYQFPEKLIPLTILNALEGKRLPVYGDGQNVRDWLYVEDHCEGIWRVLKKGNIGGKYNIGGEGERKNIEVVDKICSILEEIYPAEKNPNLWLKGIRTYKSLQTFVPDRPGHDRRYAIDASKIRRELNWQPRWGFDEGLKKTVIWYLNNRNWCNRVQRGKSARERLGLKHR